MAFQGPGLSLTLLQYYSHLSKEPTVEKNLSLSVWISPSLQLYQWPFKQSKQVNKVFLKSKLALHQE